ncbi:hypothetical protein ABB37_04455 [Leptomonas pyrrhocoris]|uniref:Uncharacterized protein n=1 Tax=Leptomonas pyrrhocoris TaxID=157538 RepID=A0A0M9G2Y9_LEPPY|nr:hypothetical protein ABB37_04455 [Leptomonas pyrrhocoris]XP_015659538.1 hypothetical protein ABB37_04455 [Leptomonas pyrrhocoris]KPA81098.1 hypothetical protein ABB37_04455 [Leptomonas pyrrhocoris]KPA81099.1 hypothetical protein ABB37_04455 [Leptomonas pyrrhocoris]|eukprot:XP_015659537.1 hypothetical protein ABB37_04455 [Leptomonas pyrrhocoris]
MPTKKNTYDVSTTVEALNTSFLFGPDCHIDRVMPDGARELIRGVVGNSRVTAVNGQVVAGSGDLKEALLAAVARHSGEAAGSAKTPGLPDFSETPIVVTFERADESAPKIAIEDSVLCNGAVSKVASPNPAAVEELLSEMKPPSANDPPPPHIDIDAELRGSFRRSMIGHPSGTPAPTSSPTTSRNQTSATSSLGTSAATAGARKEPLAAPRKTSGGSAVQPAARRLCSPPPPAASTSHHGHHARNSSSDLEEAETHSEASSSDFDTVRIYNLRESPGPEQTAAPPSNTAHPGESPTPGLLEFEKMKLSMRGDDLRGLLPTASSNLQTTNDVAELTLKGRIKRALDRVQLGSCVICVTQDVNPIAEIELLAMAQQKRVVAIDLSVKLRLRPKPEVLAVQFAEAMRSGAWFVMVNAHKSISTCLVFQELLEDAHEHKLEGFDPNARIIISLEPHPHFPKGLAHNAIILKLVSAFHGSSILSDSMAASISRTRLVTADAMTQSQIYGRSVRNSVTTPVPSTSVQKPGKKHVRISAAVEIVDIAPREVVKLSKRDCPIDVSGSVALFKTFSGVDNDKFLCVQSAGEPGRFAVGSSCGNVYFLDSLGNSLLQAHAHNASIWDVSFNDKFHFATGCEDGTSAAWKLGATPSGDAANDAVLVPTAATSLGSDVYCVCYLKNMNPSPLLIGGLHSSLVIRDAGSDAVHLVPIPSNAQVVDCLPSSATALVGGGDGSVCVIDVATTKPLGTLVDHTRKLPALAVRDDNQFFTGSFDSSILSWDLRVPGGVTSSVQTGAAGSSVVTELSAHTMHTLKLKNYVTGLDIDDVHLAANVGENLYLWDVRKLQTVLGGFPQGWKGLSRGIKVQSSAHLIVTASPDGFVRFWNFV